MNLETLMHDKLRISSVYIRLWLAEFLGTFILIVRTKEATVHISVNAIWRLNDAYIRAQLKNREFTEEYLSLHRLLHAIWFGFSLYRQEGPRMFFCHSRKLILSA